ncbi:unnamed protein product [Blepharisma stoltei]|uniref:SCP2 domain-containing protein n=1 Tax=Blepharisma stoltei TaxID=1481888 RepID=A0AAU9IUF9_9CILI|nr:unnamed protein product [Blepharisma stoltei]
MATLKAEALFNAMGDHLRATGAKLVKQIGAIYHLEILPKPGDEPVVFTIDLKNGSGSMTKGRVGSADATFTMTDDNFMAIAQGRINPQVAFMQGKMKIKGDMAHATKFTPDILPKTPKL